MIRIWVLAIVVSVLVAAPCSGAVQKTPPLFDQLHQAILEQEPKWQIERKVNPNSRHMSIYLKAGKNRIALMVDILGSDKEAAERFENWDREISDTSLQTPIEANRVKNSLPLLGDENHLWASPSHKAATILFRKKNAFVMVIGSFENDVKSFALLVSDQLAATQQALAADSP